MSFVGLHTHGDYSLLDGASQIPQLINRCLELDMPEIAAIAYRIDCHSTIQQLHSFSNTFNPVTRMKVLGYLVPNITS
jgi:hypothetical protein